MFGTSPQARIERGIARALAGFSAKFPSNVPGINFSAHVAGYIRGDVTNVVDMDDLILASRLAIRGAASELCQECDPSDISAAQDFCNRELRFPRPIGGHNLCCGAEVSLYLAKDDEAALRVFESALREQALRDEIENQRIAAMHKIFADPGSLLTWWLDRRAQDSKVLPKPEDLKAIAALFTAFPSDVSGRMDRQLLDLLRSFVSSFPELHQKRMLITLMAAAFRRAGQGYLAEQAERLAQ